MTSKEDYKIICIDGGGTKTRGVLFSGNDNIAELTFGTTRIGTIGFGEACERTLNMIIELCKSANIDKITEIDVIVVGLAGAWLDNEKKRAMHLIKTLASTSNNKINDLIVTSDAEIAMEGAFNGANGVITIVGTGSIGLAKYDDDKPVARCGGWGIELDDEGSGAWVGREGITAVVRSLDGRGIKTILTDKLITEIPRFNISEPRTIVSVYNDKLFEYQNITPLVMECATEGDEVCADIIQRASKHLAELPISLIKHFEIQKVDVALMGGIIDNDTLLGNMLKDELKKNQRINLVQPIGDAIIGAKNIGLRIIENQQ
jgi:N-acetylglucosamine kinase-like BadF-type ATPase